MDVGAFYWDTPLVNGDNGSNEQLSNGALPSVAGTLLLFSWPGLLLPLLVLPITVGEFERFAVPIVGFAAFLYLLAFPANSIVWWLYRRKIFAEFAHARDEVKALKIAQVIGILFTFISPAIAFGVCLATFRLDLH